MNTDINQNIERIVLALKSERNMKVTHIAKAIGFTTTTQLNNITGSSSGISGNAMAGIVYNLGVNPVYLFFGTGEMFLKDEGKEKEEEEKVDWESEYKKLELKLKMCESELKFAIRRNNKLIDITSIALEKTQKSDTSKEEGLEEQ